MDTTQKNRDVSRQRSQQQGTQKAASQRAGQSTQQRPQQTAQRRTEAGAAQPKRSTGQAARSPQSKAAAKQKQRTAAKPAQQRTKQVTAKKTAARQTGLPDSVSNKKRAYGNSKPKKKSALSTLVGTVQNAKKKSAARKASKGGARQKNTTPTPAVIYTQPLPFNRDRLIVQLLTVVAVVLAVILGLSVFFKVEVIRVSGADVYSAYAVREASGISEGDNLLTFSKIRAASQIQAKLPYVESVRIGIKLPNTVNIIIKEESVVYVIKDSGGTSWLMDSDGRVVEQATNATASGCTEVLGVTLENPKPNERAVATETVPTETNELGELIPVTTTGAQRLTAALQILKALEENDIVGDAASVDVTQPNDILLWYGTRYQVNLGDSARLEYKIACMNDVILQMSDYQSGILDISFTIWPNQVGYTPFE